MTNVPAAAPRSARSKQHIAMVLEDDAQLLSDTQLQQLLADESPPIQEEILRINSDARPRSLQVALLVPILAALVGFLNSFRMMRLPEITLVASSELGSFG
jgi:hypothetical protein